MVHTKWIINSYTIEIISSLFRWFFLIVGMLVFYYPPLTSIVQPNGDHFIWILTLGFFYMFIAQVVLHRYPETSKVFILITRSSIVFDIFITFWFIHATGGSESPFFLIFYLIPIHAGVYWALRGAIHSATVISILYTIYLFRMGYFTNGGHWLKFTTDIVFLYLISFYGGVLIQKERNHYRKMAHYQKQANGDYLTGLYNHRHFQECLKRKIAQKEPFFLILMDIDYFKKINDRFGHLMGDRVLQEMGNLLRKYLFVKNTKAFRYGGEEFALLVDTEDLKEVKALIQSIKDRLGAKSFNKDNVEFQVTLSFGVTAFQKGDSPSQVVEKADQLLYLSKKKGRNVASYQLDEPLEKVL